MHTQIIVGTARADVAFVKASSTVKEAKHEVRRISDLVKRPHPEADPTAIEPGNGDPFGDPVTEAREVEEAREVLDAARETLAEAITIGGVVPIADTQKQQGVTREDGTWVDLTDVLADIDQATRLEGATVEATVYLNTIPRMWVRDSYYIVPSGPDAVKFLGHLWWGLRETHTAALVRWTKKTAQYLGAIVPTGTTSRSAMVLLEIEWAAARKGMPPMAQLDLDMVPDTGKAVAIEGMRAMLRPANVIDEMRDERVAQRAVVLNAARSGDKWKLPTPSKTPKAADELGKVLVAAAK